MGESRRVALLARPGEACERLRAALREAGGDIVLEGDPSQLEPQALRAAAVETVLVALDPAVEDALEKFDEVLSDRAVEVIFDEADVAARREGWDAARWVRHLAAKLHRHDDVLPPGREPDADAPAPVASIQDVDAIAGTVDLAGIELEEAIDPEGVDLGGISFDEESEPEGVAFEELTLGEVDLGGIELDAVDLSFADASTTVALEAPTEVVLEPVAETASTAASSFGGLAFTDDINALDFDAADTAAPVELAAPTFGQDVQDFDALMRDLGGEGAQGAGTEEAVLDMPPVRQFAPKETLPNLDFDIASPEAPTAREVELAMPDFGSLSLEAVSDAPAGMTLKATDAPIAPKFKHDLSDLERRISSLSLVGEAPDAPAAKPAPAPAAKAPAAAPAVDFSALEMTPVDDAPVASPGPIASDARGAVLILAGIGGPDAVRQILTALPQGFPRAVLISQRLDGGRYDRLVQQMARAAALPVHLAEASANVAPGHVYILPPDIGVDAANGLRFVAGASQLEALPADDSAVLLLSGADPALVDAALAQAGHGALVAGQSPDGCYDAAAPAALLARGGTAGTPHELVQSLLQRWPARNP